jgi:O-antigen ligase
VSVELKMNVNGSLIRPGSLSDWIFLVLMLWFGSYAYLYFFTVGGPKPLYSYVVLIAAAAAVAVVRTAYAIRPDALFDFQARSFVAVLFAYLLYGLAWFLMSTQSEVAVQILITLVESVFIGIALTILICHERRFRLTIMALALLAVLATILNVWDFARPAFSNVPGRAAGLYVNANTSGAFIVLAMLAGVTAIPDRLRLAFVTVCGIGVAITFSRSALLTWVIAALALAFSRQLGRIRKRTLVMMFGAIALVAVVGIQLLGQLVPALDISALSQLLTPNTAARLGIGGDPLGGDAADDRIQALMYALEQFSIAPVLGHGLGYSFEWAYPQAPHNMYLLFLAEGGTIGLTLYLSLLLILWLASVGVGRIIVLEIALFGFFSHNLLEQPGTLIFMAFVVAHGANARLNEAPVPSSPAGT